MNEYVNPHDTDLEEAVIGACLIESKAITLVDDKLCPEVFYIQKIGIRRKEKQSST